MKPIVVREQVIHSEGWTDRTYSKEDLEEIWGEGSDEIIPQLIRQCDQLEAKNEQIIEAIAKLTQRHPCSCPFCLDLLYKLDAAKDDEM